MATASIIVTFNVGVTAAQQTADIANDGVTAAKQTGDIASDGGTELSSITPLRMHVIDVPAAEISTYIATYQADPHVASVDRDGTRDAEGTPSDPAYSSQWALPQTAWDQAFGAINPLGSATIAILDTGVDGGNSDLSGRLTAGWSAFGTDPTSDPNGHGTSMASIAFVLTRGVVNARGVGVSCLSSLYCLLDGEDLVGGTLRSPTRMRVVRRPGSDRIRGEPCDRGRRASAWAGQSTSNRGRF